MFLPPVSSKYARFARLVFSLHAAHAQRQRQRQRHSRCDYDLWVEVESAHVHIGVGQEVFGNRGAF